MPGSLDSHQANSCGSSRQQNEGKSHTRSQTDTEKAFDEIQRPLMTETLNNVGTEGTYLNVPKAAYGRPIASVIPDGETFPLRSGRQARPLSPLSLKRVLEAVATAIRQEKEIKDI